MSYNMNDIIYKKREGGKLSKDELEYFIKGYVAGDIPDYQASALLMAIFLGVSIGRKPSGSRTPCAIREIPSTFLRLRV